MAESVANLPISNSYVGLLRISSDATGVSGTPVPVYTSDGEETVLSLGTSSAVINGSLTANDIITNTITTNLLGVNDETIFGNKITFSKASDEEPGVINDTGVIFENKGTFKSTGTIISEGTANFTTLACTEDVSVGGNFTITDIASFDSTEITFVKNFNCTQTASFANVKLNNISVASGTGITVNSPTSFTGTLTTTNNTTLGGSLFAINATNTTFNKAVTFKNTVALGSDATALTQVANDNSTKVATTAYVDRALASSGSIPDYSNGTYLANTTFTCPTNGMFLLGVPGKSNGQFFINNVSLCYWNHHYNYTEPSWTSFIVGKGDVIKLTGSANGHFLPFK